MRPVKLIMQAFGSYGKLTQIDFQEPNQNLFLVTGDTGAGKTTIFDFITSEKKYQSQFFSGNKSVRENSGILNSNQRKVLLYCGHKERKGAIPT